MEAPSNFDFVPRTAVPSVDYAARRAEEFAQGDARASGFYSRLALELALSGFARRRGVSRTGRTLGALIGDVEGVRYVEGRRVRTGGRLFGEKEVALFSRVNGLGTDAVHGRRFDQTKALDCLEGMHGALDLIGGESGWPEPARVFDPRLVPDAPPRFIAIGRRGVRRLETELDALRREHDELWVFHAELQGEAAGFEDRLRGQLETIESLRRELADARGDVEGLRDEVARLTAVVDASVPAAEHAELRARLDAARGALAEREAAYREILAGAGLTSTRHFHDRGVLDLPGLLTIADDDGRPDEQDEAAAVVLERLGDRLDKFFLPTTDA